MSWRVIVWRRDRRGVWSQWATYPGDRVQDAMEEARVLTVAAVSELFVALPAGQVPAS